MVKKQSHSSILQNSPLFFFVAKTAVGKDTFVDDMCKRYPSSSKKIVTSTTRTMRPGEIEGVTAYFVTMDKYREWQAKNLLFNDICPPYGGGNHYGYLKSEIVGGNMLHGIPETALEFKERLSGEREVIIVMLTASREEQFLRVKERPEGLDFYEKRFADEDLMYAGLESKADYVLKNETFDQLSKNCAFIHSLLF